MNNQFAVLAVENIFKIHSNLNVENSLYLTRLLFEYVEQGKITFELNSKKGSVVSEFVVSVVSGVFSSVIYELAKKIYNKLKEEKVKGKEVKPVYIFLKDRQYIITGEEIDNLPE